MKLNTMFIPALAIVLAALPVVAQTKAVEPPCSLATLKGTFGVLEHGTFVAPFPGVSLTPPFPMVLSANPTFDGKGNFSGTFAANVGGLPLSGTFTGTYTVGRDCTYSDSFTTSLGTAASHTGTITGRGMFQQIHYIYTDTISVVSGTAKKTRPSGCSLKTPKGSNGTVEEGTWYVPEPLPFVTESTGSSDGAGNFSGIATSNVAGMVMTGAFVAGTYSVGADCSYSSEYSIPGFGVYHTVGTITGQGMFQEIPYIYIDPGLVAFGTIKKR